MTRDAYNYTEFKSTPQEFHNFAVHAPKVTMRAPSFPLEDAATGGLIEMKDLWKKEIVVMEFGSFT